MSDILPDCRSRQVKTSNFGVLGNWVPVYCANCGASGGNVPEENMTFIFYLCNTCAETYGHIANTMMMPDEVFWSKLANEQLETYGRYLDEQEFIAEVEKGSPLTSLLKERS